MICMLASHETRVRATRLTWKELGFLSHRFELLMYLFITDLHSGETKKSIYRQLRLMP